MGIGCWVLVGHYRSISVAFGYMCVWKGSVARVAGHKSCASLRLHCRSVYMTFDSDKVHILFNNMILLNFSATCLLNQLRSYPYELLFATDLSLKVAPMQLTGN